LPKKKNNPYKKSISSDYLWKGYREVSLVFRELRSMPVANRFLASFFFYSMGVQTVMYLAASFGEKELKMPAEELILTVLIIQLVAIGGSFLFAFISKRIGNKNSLVIMVFIWMGICVAAYFVHSVYQFYALAFVVGMVMGGIQSLSRSTYAKLIPTTTTDHASFLTLSKNGPTPEIA